MTTTLPTTPEEILQLAETDAEYAEKVNNSRYAEALKWDVAKHKEIFAQYLPKRQQDLAASRPAELTETEKYITLRDGFQSRILVTYKTVPVSDKAPLILLFFGGSFCFGDPETEMTLARELALNDMVVICPSYRLAPENPFPCGINDAWDTVQWAAAESLRTDSSILPSFTDTHSGFIVGGTSAGAGITSVIAHLSRDNKLNPPVTGQALFAGSYISERSIPAKYQSRYLSRKQIDAPHRQKFRAALNPDYSSPMFAAFDQHDPDDKEGEVAKGHVGLCPAYFQVCGKDSSRDDGLIYESVLREESHVPTRIDLYHGLPHCWWAFYPHLDSSKKRLKDSVLGIKWLLENPQSQSTKS